MSFMSGFISGVLAIVLAQVLLLVRIFGKKDDDDEADT